MDSLCLKISPNASARNASCAKPAASRLPPNQALTLKWPVLHVGSVPRFDPQTWDFKVSGLVDQRLRLTWDEFSHLPMTQVTADMHCVTRWSRFDVRWEGVLFSDLLKLIRVRPAATHVMVEAEHGYTSNVPLADLLRPTTLFALKHHGEPLSADHGYPLRLVVPNLYAWKSVKWVRGLEFMTTTNRVSGSKTATTSTATPSKKKDSAAN
jgi:DMSO/TMAO reductase YedYZ molybdopterin-dependent catalytic subunit